MSDRRARSAYDPAAYWSEVARRVCERGTDPDLAGNGGPFHRYRREVSRNWLFELLPVTGLSVLEFGCGPGGNLRLIAERQPARLVGADISPAMADLARASTQAEVVRLDDAGLPFGEREFDSTLTHTVLQHNPRSALPGIVSELTRVTRSTLVLIEDTAALRERSFGGSYWVRHNESYIALVTACGFRFCDVHEADVWLSEKTWLAIRRLMSLVDRRDHNEGGPVSPIEERLGQAALTVTRHLDRFFPQFSGKSALRFERL